MSNWKSPLQAKIFRNCDFSNFHPIWSTFPAIWQKLQLLQGNSSRDCLGRGFGQCLKVKGRRGGCGGSRGKCPRTFQSGGTMPLHFSPLFCWKSAPNSMKNHKFWKFLSAAGSSSLIFVFLILDGIKHCTIVPHLIFLLLKSLSGTLNYIRFSTFFWDFILPLDS